MVDFIDSETDESQEKDEFDHIEKKKLNTLIANHVISCDATSHQTIDHALSRGRCYLPEITSGPQTTQKTRGDRDQHKLTKIKKAKPRCLSTGKTVNATSRKDCRNCYKKKKRVNTTTECKKCPGSPPLCLDCFFELHDCTPK